MKTVIGLCFIIGGTALALYLGIWLCLVGGIVDIITEVRAVDMDTFILSLGVLKIVFSKFVTKFVSNVFIIAGKQIGTE